MGGSLQRTRGFRLEQVKATADAGDPKPQVFKFRANDGEFDRYQDRLSVQGWKLDSFNANPVILYNHDAGDGGFLGLGAKDVLPIGKGRAYVEGNALMVDIEFDQDDEFAKKVERKVEKGILNAVSVRYLLPEGSYKENEKGGLDSSAQELLEISVVTIPGNQRALRVKGLDESEVDVFTEKIALRAAQIVVKALDDRDARKAAPAPTPAPVEAPKVEPVDVHKLARLIAAETLTHMEKR
jgi:HK97 family phage prohead protease